jgi:putative ubiquitin-RnfH superfamily antitoxin RatB of RatAB toxin-antitoxin module
MGRSKLITIELVFATAEEQVLLTSNVADGISAREAVCNSDLIAKFPSVDFAKCPLGVWGKIIAGSQRLKEGDRVEAYRPLICDPRDARRELALAGQSMGTRS